MLSLPASSVCCAPAAASRARRSVACSSAVPRRSMLIGSIASLLLINANQAVAESEVDNAAMVKARKERLAAKKAAMDAKAASEPKKAAEEGAKKKAGGAGPKSMKSEEGSRGDKLAAGKKARLAALKEKAAKIREGGAPTF